MAGLVARGGRAGGRSGSLWVVGLVARGGRAGARTRDGRARASG